MLSSGTILIIQIHIIGIAFWYNHRNTNHTTRCSMSPAAILIISFWFQNKIDGIRLYMFGEYIILIIYN